MKLLGKGIYLRFLEEGDAAALLALNERNRAFFQPFLIDRIESFYTLEYQIASIRRAHALRERDELYQLGIFLEARDELIGLVSLTEVVRGSLQSCWLGYYLDENQNGHGYTTEAVRLAVRYCFDVLKLHRVEAGVMPHNKASARVLEKAGFELEGLSKKNVRINGKWEDHLHFAIINPDD